MTFSLAAGGVDLDLLLQMAAKIGEYVIVYSKIVGDVTRWIYQTYKSFRAARKAYVGSLLSAAIVYVWALVPGSPPGNVPAWHVVNWQKQPHI